MKEINIKIIPHSHQRYDTCGDWWFDEKNDLFIRVSESGNWKYNVLVALHEAHEALLCKDRGIDERAITQFDIEFEDSRIKGNDDEPGDDPKAPYKKEHFFATNLERMFAAELGVDWNEYDKEINNL